jgi:hypothetical protein
MPQPKKESLTEITRSLLPEANMPETVTITLTKHNKKFMALRQHIGQGEIEGHKVNVSYNIAGGGPIIEIGGVAYEGHLKDMITALFEQISSPS